MKKLHLHENGSHIVAIALIILAVGIIGFAGYTVMNRNDKTKNDTAATPTTTIEPPASIKNRSDLTKTNASLDDANANLNSDLDTSSLDSSLNDLL